MPTRSVLIAFLVVVLLIVAGWLWHTSTTTPAQTSGLPTDSKLLNVFRAVPPAFRLKGRVEEFSPQNLQDHINGAAPVYLQRQFRAAVVALFETREGLEVSCDVFDMTTAANAQSIMETERPGAVQEDPLWPGALVGSSVAVFRVDRYFVKLVVFDLRARSLLSELGRAVETGLK